MKNKNEKKNKNWNLGKQYYKFLIVEIWKPTIIYKFFAVLILSLLTIVKLSP